MDNKNIIIGGLVLTVLYLLKKNKSTTQPTQKVILLNNTKYYRGNGDQYKLELYSDKPIEAAYIPKSKKGNKLEANLLLNVYDDYATNWNRITGITNKIPATC